MTNREIMQQALSAFEAIMFEKNAESCQIIAKNARYLLREALAQPEQEPVHFLANGVRYKVTHQGYYGCSIVGLPENLNGQWVALVEATDSKHLNCIAPQESTKPEQELIAWLVSDAQGRYATIRDPAPYGEEVYEPLYTAPPKPEQWTPVEIGVDVTPDGAHVVGMYVLMPEVVRHVFYSQFHPAPKRKWVGLTDDEINKIVDLNTSDDGGFDIWCDGIAVAHIVCAKIKELNK